MFSWQSDVRKRGHVVIIFTQQSDVRKDGHVVPIFIRQTEIINGFGDSEQKIKSNLFAECLPLYMYAIGFKIRS